MSENLPTQRSNQLDKFLKRMAAQKSAAPRGSGRLIFALDATASRQDTWDKACELQSEMFAEAGKCQLPADDQDYGLARLHAAHTRPAA
jgi:hypothetical protein